MLASSQSRPSPVPLDVRQSALDRCVREQRQIVREMAASHAVTSDQLLGYVDWEMEKRFIAHVEPAIAGSTENSGEAKPSC